MNNKRNSSKGQVLVIFVVTLIVLLLFVGLALDAGSVYVTYGSLKRAVDSAALAAINEFKRDPNLTSMTAAAEEVFNLMNVEYSTVEVLLCDADKDNIRDTGLPPIFYARCPDTPTEAPRKLVWVQAQQQAPLYFLSLMGFNSVTLHTNSISEAAPLDVVIVLDTSESMASDTAGYSANAPFDPAGCNGSNTCEPMVVAKEAAKALIDSLADGYDQVSVVTYDKTARVEFLLSTDLLAAKNAIDLINVHDDPPVVFNVWSKWWANPGVYNPVNSEDLDGDGDDDDDFPAMYGVDCPFHPSDPALDPAHLLDRWWDVADGGPDPYGWGGVPCDRDDRFDSMDWDWNGYDGMWTEEDHTAASSWSGGDPNYKFTGLSTCIGCGVRVGANQLRNGGRFGSVWVMVFLSDGAANLSDTNATNSDIPVGMVSGFCGGSAGQPFWTTSCFDNDFTPRFCVDTNASTCPPGSTHTAVSPPYSVLDYARDMVDEAALTSSANANEKRGNELAIYTIRLGSMSVGSAEPFLRYMAAVGDDGDRTTDPCALVAANTSCGQYYNAPTSDKLLPIFEDIASRIYTRLTQ